MKSKSSQGASGSGVVGDVEGRMKVLSDTSVSVSAMVAQRTWCYSRTSDGSTDDCFAVEVRCLVSNADLTELAHVDL